MAIGKENLKSGQNDKFIAAARAAECDKSEAAFNAKLKQIAKPALVKKGKGK